MRIVAAVRVRVQCKRSHLSHDQRHMTSEIGSTHFSCMGVAIGVVLVLVRVKGVMGVMMRVKGIVRVVFVSGVVWLVPPGMRVMSVVVARGVHVDIYLGGARQMCQDLLAGALGEGMRPGPRRRTGHPEIQWGVKPAAPPPRAEFFPSFPAPARPRPRAQFGNAGAAACSPMR